MAEGRSMIRAWWPVVPCGLTVLFFLFWVFDLGHGPFSGPRFGTAGEWAAAVGTTAAVAVSLSVLLSNRHEARQRELRAEVERLRERIRGNQPEADRSLREIPIFWSIDALEDESSDPTLTRYQLSFEMLNGSANPLLNLRVHFELTRDWTGREQTEWMDAMRAFQEAGDDEGLRMWVKEYPYPAKVLEEKLVAAGARPSKALKVELVSERVRSGGALVVTWEVGTIQFTHTVGRDGRPHRSARLILEDRRPLTS